MLLILKKYFLVDLSLRNVLLILCSIFFATEVFSAPATITFQARIVKPDLTNLESSNVSFKFYYLYPKPAGTDLQCVIYAEEINGVNMTGSKGLVTLQLGSGTRTYGSGNLKNVFDNSTASYACQAGGTYVPAANDNRRILVQFNDGTGVQTLPASELTAVPYAMQSYNSQRLGNTLATDFLKFTDFTGTCGAGEYLKYDSSSSPKFSCAIPTGTGAGIVMSVAPGTGPLLVGGTAADPTISIPKASVSADGYLSSADFTTFNSKLSVATLLSSDITTKLGFTPAANNDSRLSDTRTPTDGSVTAAKIASATITFDKFNQSSAISGQVIKWNGSAWVASSDLTVAGSVASVTSGGAPIIVGGTATNPTISLAKATGSVDGYLSSADFTIFAAKLSDFSSLLSSDITGKLGYTPVNPAIAVTSVAGRTGVVTLSSSDITGLSFGTTSGTYAQGSDSRFTDERTPATDSVTSAKILDGTITSADLSSASVTASKLESATNGQIFIGNGSGFTKATLTGTTDQVNVTNGSGTITLSTPQSIATSSSPSFTGLTVSGITGNTLLRANGSGVLANATSTDITGLLGFTPANATSAWSLNASGDVSRMTSNVGIGTTSPKAQLHINNLALSPADNTGIPGAVGEGALYLNTVRTGGFGSYGNFQNTYTVSASTPAGQFDSGITSWVTGQNLTGGQMFGSWFGANTPNSEIGQTFTSGAAIGMEINVGNRWGDFGLLTDVGGTRYTVGLQIVPDILPAIDSAPPAGKYPGSFALAIGPSVSGHKWWVGQLLRSDTLVPSGHANYIYGGSTLPLAPLDYLSLRGYWTNGIDLSNAVISTSAFKSNGFDINKNGYVGIGLTPFTPLSVLGGNGSPSLSSDATGIVTFGSNTTTQLQFGAVNGGAFPFWLQTKQSTNSGAFFPLSLNPLGGNIGIGTTSQLAPFHVAGMSATTGTISSTGTTVNGTGTNFTTAFAVGDQIIASNGVARTISAITNATTLTISSAFSPDLAAGTGYARVGVILNTGNVGVGNTAPRATLDVTGTIVSRASQSFAAGTIDFSTSNLRHTTQNCGAFILHNLKDGGTYMFAVQGTSVATCSFTAFSDTGSTSLTVHMPPDHAATTTGKHTIYNIAVLGTHAYIAWTPGY